MFRYVFCGILISLILGLLLFALAESNRVLSPVIEPDQLTISQLYQLETLAAHDLAAGPAQQLIPTLSSQAWERSATFPNAGFSENALWLSFPLIVPDHLRTEAAPLMLRIANPLLRKLDVYIVDQLADDRGVIRQEYRTGAARPFASRPVAATDFVIPLALPSTGQRWITLRAESEYALKVPLQLYTEDELNLAQGGTNLLQGGYFGIVLFLALASLTLYGITYDRSLLLYSGFVTAVACWLAVARGYAYEFLWPAFPDWNEDAFIIFLLVGTALSVLFTRDFLRLREYAPRFDSALQGLAWVWFGLLFCAYFLPAATVLGITSVLLIIGGCMLMAAGLWTARLGVREAQFYLVAWTLIIVSAISIMLSYMGFFGGTYFPENLFQLGAVVEATVLGLGLASRVRSKWLRRANAEKAALQLEAEMQHQKLTEQHRIREELEARVSDRTRELEQTLEKLADVNKELEALTTIDALTGVANRRELDAQLPKEWKRMARLQAPLSILLLDIDHFKAVNDTYGHPVGDECLKAVADMLVRSVRRPPDVVCRYGGEEFLVLLPNTMQSGAMRVAENIRNTIARSPLATSAGEISLTISIGAASVQPQPLPSTDPNALILEETESLVKRADSALYMAKQGGRNQVKMAA